MSDRPAVDARIHSIRLECFAIDGLTSWTPQCDRGFLLGSCRSVRSRTWSLNFSIFCAIAHNRCDLFTYLISDPDLYPHERFVETLQKGAVKAESSYSAWLRLEPCRTIV